MKIIPNTGLRKHLAPILLESFETIQDIESQFQINFIDERILIAGYEQNSYDGSAYVLFEKDNKLYEVHASHCSCYGLEDQWEPEEVVLQELRNRVINGTGCYLANCEDALKLMLGINEN